MMLVAAEQASIVLVRTRKHNLIIYLSMIIVEWEH